MLFICANDSGLTYIGYLLGKTTFVIYGFTNPDFHNPYGSCHSYIDK